jgi:hypothetical protein
MRIRTIITTLAASLVLLIALVAYLVIYSGSVVAALATGPEPDVPVAVDVHEATPELPDWAKGTHWLIYPDGFQCVGTEGCPNDYRTIGGEVGPVLPEGVEYYDPAKHDCVQVQPVGVTC